MISDTRPSSVEISSGRGIRARAGRSSFVSSGTRSPGGGMGPKQSLRLAPGRPRSFRRPLSVAGDGGSTSTPRRSHRSGCGPPGRGKAGGGCGGAAPPVCPCPARILASQGQDGFGLPGGPGGLSQPVRTMRVALEAGEGVGSRAARPAIEGLATAPEMAAGEGRIAPVREIVGHPLKRPSRVAAQLPPARFRGTASRPRR